MPFVKENTPTPSLIRFCGFDDKDFEAVGPNLIEDAADFGYTHGVIELLTKKKRTAKAKRCVKWLDEAFGLTPDKVLKVPDDKDIVRRIHTLTDFVVKAIP